MFHKTCNCVITEQGRCVHYNLPLLQKFQIEPCTCFNPLLCKHSDGNVRFSTEETFKCRHTHRTTEEYNVTRCIDCDTVLQ